jgi:hypothetical protein
LGSFKCVEGWVNIVDRNIFNAARTNTNRSILSNSDTDFLFEQVQAALPMESLFGNPLKQIHKDHSTQKFSWHIPAAIASGLLALVLLLVALGVTEQSNYTIYPQQTSKAVSMAQISDAPEKLSTKDFINEVPAKEKVTIAPIENTGRPDPMAPLVQEKDPNAEIDALTGLSKKPKDVLEGVEFVGFVGGKKAQDNVAIFNITAGGVTQNAVRKINETFEANGHIVRLKKATQYDVVLNVDGQNRTKYLSDFIDDGNSVSAQAGSTASTPSVEALPNGKAVSGDAKKAIAKVLSEVNE